MTSRSEFNFDCEICAFNSIISSGVASMKETIINRLPEKHRVYALTNFEIFEELIVDFLYAIPPTNLVFSPESFREFFLRMINDLVAKKIKEHNEEVQ